MNRVLGADPGRLKTIRTRELLLRFAFGAAVSVLAGAVSLVFNPTVGGMFLAFPAILPASLTLIEKKENRAQARLDLEGAIIGGGSLVVFAFVADVALRRASAPLALVTALGAWMAASLLGYRVVTLVVPRRRTRSAKSGPTR